MGEISLAVENLINLSFHAEKSNEKMANRYHGISYSGRISSYSLVEYSVTFPSSVQVFV